MGVIKSQSIYSTLISYVGVVLGFLTSALVLPKILTPDQLGLTKLIVAVTGVFSGIFSFGIAQLLFIAYAQFSDELEKRAKLFYFAIKVAFIGSIAALPFYYFMAYDLFNYNTQITDFSKTEWFIAATFIVITMRILYAALFGYVRMTNQIVIDTFIQNIFLKGGLLLFALIYVLDWMNFTQFVYAEMILFVFFPVIIIGYLLIKRSIPKHPKGISFSKKEKKDFLQLSIFGTLTAIGGSLYLYLDTLMVNHYLGESEVGIYGTLYLFGVIVIVPARSLKAIAVPFLSKAFKNKEFEEVENIYQKSSAVLLVVGGYIFLGVYLNLYSVFAYLPSDFAVGGTIVLFIGLAQIVDMASGVNFEVIASSERYRLNTWFIFLAALTGVLFNVLFIPKWGVNGAAFATFTSVTLVNILRIIAVWKRYKIQPFRRSTLKTLGLMTVVFFLVSAIPNVDNFIWNLVIKSTIITLLYVPAVYFLRLSEDINEFIDNILVKLKVKK